MGERAVKPPEQAIKPAPSAPVEAARPKRSGEPFGKRRSGLDQVIALSTPETGFTYLAENNQLFFASIIGQLRHRSVPRTPDIDWVPGGIAARFRDAFVAAFGDDNLFRQIKDIVHPTDPYYAIDSNRPLVSGIPGDKRTPPKGPLAFQSTAGQALALVVDESLQASVARMVPRLFERSGSEQEVRPHDLVTSHPMDRLVAHLLCDPRVLRVTTKKGTKRHRATGLRHVDNYRWLDGNRWNWVRVIEPSDATVEEIAATLEHDYRSSWLSYDDLTAGKLPFDPAKSYLAYKLTGTSPLFRVERQWAAKLNPDGASRDPDSGGTHRDNDLVLTEAPDATDTAILQAKHGHPPHESARPVDLEHLVAVLQKSEGQLRRAARALPAELYELVLPALQWVARHREHLTEFEPHQLRDLAPVIEGQQTILFEAVGAIEDLAPMARGAAKAEHGGSPIVDATRDFAIAAGESHLVESARRRLEIARRARTEMGLRILDRSLLGGQIAVGELEATEDKPTIESIRARAEYRELGRRLRDMRARKAAGEQIDTGEQQMLGYRLTLHAIDTRARATCRRLKVLQMTAISERLNEIQKTAAAFSSDFKSLPGRAQELVDRIRHDVIEAIPTFRANHQKDTTDGLEVERKTVEDTERARDRVANDDCVRRFFEDANTLLEHQAQREQLIEVAIMIGVSFVGGMVGAAVGGAVRGAILTDAVAASTGRATVARVAGFVADVATDTAVSSVTQSALHGDFRPGELGENLISNAALRGALAPIHRVAARWNVAELEGANVKAWEHVARGGKVALRGGVVLTAEMITAAAVEYVAHRALHGAPPDDKTAARWAIEGASMAIGKFLGHKLRGFQERLVALAEQGAHLRGRVKRLTQVADKLAGEPDQNEAMEILKGHFEALRDERRLIEQLREHPGRFANTTIDALAAGNAAEMAGIRGHAMETMPLRLRGLEPDDASGRVWIGNTEDIAIALQQASQSGLDVEVLGHDVAAREWRVRYNGKELTIVERKLEGRPREAKHEITDADREHARRYAEAAAFLQQRWLEHNEVGFVGDIQVDSVQAGHAVAGVMNQATAADSGEGLGKTFIVYEHAGALAYRGDQNLGQDKTVMDAPGIRSSEQAPAGPGRLKSNEMGRALAIGQLETQGYAVRGRATAPEARPDPISADWKFPHRRWRTMVHLKNGKQGWVYSDSVDVAVGMGPAELSAMRALVSPAQLRSMLSSDQLIPGDAVDFTSRIKPGKVCVIGASPTGAWAAEAAARHGSHATLVGGSREGGEDWAATRKVFEEEMAKAATDPAAFDPRRVAELEAQLKAVHPGNNPRNREPGAPYEKGFLPRMPDDVQLEFGNPTKVEVRPDGRLYVEFAKGSTAQSGVYDQLVLAHGQDPSAPGGAASFLGPAPKAGGSMTGTIMLRPVFSPRPGGGQDIVALESVDPPGLTLKGAAFASKKLAPWIVEEYRQQFLDELDTMANAGASTRDHGPIGVDSDRVQPGIEIQRDRLPRANEVLNAQRYRLPGTDHELVLDPAHRDRWEAQVREFFIKALRADPKWVVVKRLVDGRSGAAPFRVWVGGNDVGVFKVFDGAGGAAVEQEMLKLLEKAKLKYLKVVRERGQIHIDDKTGMKGDALLMDTANGESVKQMIETLPASGEPARGCDREADRGRPEGGQRAGRDAREVRLSRRQWQYRVDDQGEEARGCQPHVGPILLQRPWRHANPYTARDDLRPGEAGDPGADARCVPEGACAGHRLPR